MLGEPTFIARHNRSDAQRKALLAKERIAAVAGPKGPDLARLREMHDPFFFFVGRPRQIFFARRERLAYGVHAGHELSIAAKPLRHRVPHARHDAHAHRHVSRVRDFHPDVSDVRADGTHRERHYVHRASAHAALEQAIQRAAHFLGVDPVVGRPGVLLAAAADERALLHARDIRRMRASEKRVGSEFVVQPDEGPGAHQLIAQAVIFGLRAIAPVHAVGFCQARNLADPFTQSLVTHPGWCV